MGCVTFFVAPPPCQRLWFLSRLAPTHVDTRISHAPRRRGSVDVRHACRPQVVAVGAVHVAELAEGDREQLQALVTLLAQEAALESALHAPEAHLQHTRTARPLTP